MITYMVTYDKYMSNGTLGVLSLFFVCSLSLGLMVKTCLNTHLFCDALFVIIRHPSCSIYKVRHLMFIVPPFGSSTVPKVAHLFGARNNQV